jgi:cytochrome c-type biogenesis protein CcmE
MTRKQRRAAIIAFGVGILGCAVFLVIYALRDYTVGFHSPNDVVEKQIPAGRRIRLGGLIADGSLKRGEGLTVQFAITDTVKTIPVRYTGILPDLFREGQGVIAEGKLDASGGFLATYILAKHDENYMPPEVAKMLKQKGLWQHGAGAKAGVQK